MDRQSERDKVAFALRTVLILDPLPGVSVESVAAAIGMKADTLRAKFREPIPNSTTVIELLTIFRATNDSRLIKMILPANSILADLTPYQTGTFGSDTASLQADLTRELSDVLVANADALADGQYDEGELYGLIRECEEAHTVIEQLKGVANRLAVRQQRRLRLEVA